MPLVHDVYHHRCVRHGLKIEDATERARATWNHEPLLHLSSPWKGLDGPQPARHHDDIDAADFPTARLLDDLKRTG